MNRLARLTVTLAAAGGLLLLGAPAASAEPDTRFGSCREMRVVDPNGVALNNRAVKRAEKQGFRTPLLCPVAYDANRRLDTDGDGVACERRR
jgi:hypothetical protein